MMRTSPPVFATVVAAVVTVTPGPSGLDAQAGGALGEIEAPPWAGLWVGSGATFEKLLDDPIRKLSRRSESSFWFVVAEDGRVHGEAIVAYSARLEPIKFKVPVPGAGSIEAEVGGEAPRRYFRIGIGGRVVDAASGQPPDGQDREALPLTLRLIAMGEDEEGQAAPEEDGRIPGVEYQFALTASLVVPAGWGLGKASSLAGQVSTGALKGSLEGIGMGSGLLPGASPGVWTLPIPGTGWSPFQGMEPEAEHGPGEPYRVTARKDWENGSFVFWSAVQQTRSLDALDRLIEHVGVLEDLRVADLETAVTDLRAASAKLESSLVAGRRSRQELRRLVEAQGEEVEALRQELAEVRSAVDQGTGAAEASSSDREGP